MNEVIRFIRRFQRGEAVTEAFTQGCCYWFAAILYWRFMDDGAEIVYDEAANHFGALISGRVYDITGDVTESFQWRSWSELNDESHRARIIRDCILF